MRAISATAALQTAWEVTLGSLTTFSVLYSLELVLIPITHNHHYSVSHLIPYAVPEFSLSFSGVLHLSKSLLPHSFYHVK